MNIKEINIQHYGPLPKFVKTFDDGIHIIYGSNESGKTLFIDAIMKMLIGGKKFDSSLERVDEIPSGYILLNKEGQEIKLDTKQSLDEIMGIGSDDLKNIFCIRDADLQITEETEFYERIQDKLAGLRSSDIRRIISALRDRGRITAGGDLSDSAGNNNAKSIYRESSSLISQISTYLNIIREGNIEALELELIETQVNLIDYRDKLDQLEKAKHKHEFLSIQADFNELHRTNSDFKAIPAEDITKLQRLIEGYETNPVNESEVKRNLGFYNMLSLTALGLGFVAFILIYVFSLPTLAYLIPVLFLACGAYTLSQWRKNNSILSAFENLISQIVSNSRQLDIDSSEVPEIIADLAAIVKKKEDISKTMYEKQGIVKSFFNIKSKDTDEIISQAAQLLAELEKEIDYTITVVYSEKEYTRIKEILVSTQDRIDEITGLLSSHKEKLGDFSSRIAKLGYSRFMNHEIDLLIDNLEALESVIPRLEELRDRIDLEKNTAIKAIELFEVLEAEEEQKITELFSKDSSAVEIFKETTEGRYSDLRYDIDTKTIIVERPTGETLDVSKLSKGTRDQLYLAIRVSLGEKILEGSPGFFIMDDAFLSSDENRLKSQVDLIEKLSKKGWQIIYFTMKKDVMENISKITENEVLTLSPLA